MMNCFNLKFGVEIETRDKMIGHLQKVVVNPQTTHVTHVIVTQDLICKQAVVLPLHLVQNVHPDEKVEIALHSDALSDYPHFEEYGFEERGIEAGVPQLRVLSQNLIESAISLYPLDHRPCAEAAHYVEKRVIREGVEPDDVLWNEHTAIYGRQGQVGHLSQVMVEASNGRIQKLVIRQDKLLQKSFLPIPLELVQKSGESAIHVVLENSDFEELKELFEEFKELMEYAKKAPQPAPVNGHSLPAAPPLRTSTLFLPIARPWQKQGS